MFKDYSSDEKKKYLNSLKISFNKKIVDLVSKKVKKQIEVFHSHIEIYLHTDKSSLQFSKDFFDDKLIKIYQELKEEALGDDSLEILEDIYRYNWKIYLEKIVKIKI